jgi:hypothetical protein
MAPDGAYRRAMTPFEIALIKTVGVVTSGFSVGKTRVAAISKTKAGPKAASQIQPDDRGQVKRNAVLSLRGKP